VKCDYTVLAPNESDFLIHIMDVPSVLQAGIHTIKVCIIIF